ncbi:MAG TPA: thiamine diphosphokinase [Acidimicrobiia bacterium]|nr:thiamine diphosphokinase [Acidimicrobiia bacterium]
METVLIFAGGDSPSGSLTEELPEADLIVAADSGYDLALRAGYAVDVLVGDMDSIQTEVIPGHVIVERHPPDKDATDLELAIARLLVERPVRVVVVGGAGGRVDHEIATAQLLCSERWDAIDEIDWVTDRGWAHVVKGRRIIHGDPGAVISLIPVGGPAGGVYTKGLRWDLADATMPPGTTWGVSNEFTGPVADIRIGSGCLLAVVPEDR